MANQFCLELRAKCRLWESSADGDSDGDGDGDGDGSAEGQLAELEKIEAYIISAHSGSLSASRKQRLSCIKYILMRRIGLRPKKGGRIL